MSSYRSFGTLWAAARNDGAGLANPGVVGGFAGGALDVVGSILANGGLGSLSALSSAR
ncbi:MAG TPA: hypothetical protein VEF35_10150 [Candidatus Bathyarchaeia archaeon]|nr:hypothetical protein [Candidatus Bathyarchaeia archaeon]